jgi:hypothetical protein
MLKDWELDVVLECLETYPVGVDSDAWGWGPIGNSYPTGLQSDVRAEYG